MQIQRPIRIVLAAAAALLSWQAISTAQSLDGLSNISDDTLANPPAEDWLMWRRTYNSHGFTPLTQINKTNVTNLEEAWRAELSPGPNMATPLVHDGIMFLASTQDVLLALDATSGEELWRHTHESNAGPGAKIGIALYKDLVLFPTDDTHLKALNTKTGEVIWDTAITGPGAGMGPRPYGLRGAPIVANGVVVQGVTATMMPEGGFIVGLNIETGAEMWRFHTVARPDGPGGNTWNNLPLSDRSGGSVWVPGSYDAELDLAYYGTAPTYDTKSLMENLNEPGVSNDALYTNTTLALRPKTGELVWYYQHVANDQWDLDWVYERQIIEMEYEGENRKVIVTAGKMALYDALDAATGEYLFSVDSGLQNIITAIDPETGAKTIHPNAIVPNAEDTHLLCPFANGGRNWQSGAVNPETKMLYLPLAEVCMMAGPTGQGGVLSSGAGMRPAPLPDSDGKFGRLQAINLNTQETAWTFREVVPPTSGVMTTASGLIFGGALDMSFKAFDDSNGEILWQTNLGDIPASFPISYAVDGKQYIAIVVGQPSLHANLWIGVVSGFLGEENSPVVNLQRTGAAIVVYAL